MAETLVDHEGDTLIDDASQDNKWGTVIQSVEAEVGRDIASALSRLVFLSGNTDLEKELELLYSLANPSEAPTDGDASLTNALSVFTPGKRYILAKAMQSRLGDRMYSRASEVHRARVNADKALKRIGNFVKMVRDPLILQTIEKARHESGARFFKLLGPIKELMMEFEKSRALWRRPGSTRRSSSANAEWTWRRLHLRSLTTKPTSSQLNLRKFCNQCRSYPAAMRIVGQSSSMLPLT